MLASTLDTIPICVRSVPSMIVVLNAEVALLLAAHANKKYGENRRSPTIVPCLLVKTHGRLTFIAAFTVHAKQVYYIFF